MKKLIGKSSMASGRTMCKHLSSHSSHQERMRLWLRQPGASEKQPDAASNIPQHHW